MWIVWALTCFIWSTVWLAIKIGVMNVPPFTFACARLVVAFAVLVVGRAIIGRLKVPASRDATVLIGSGVLLLGVNYACVFWGSRFVPSGLVAVMQSATPLFGLVVARAFGLEDITPRKVAGLVGGIAGVALLSARQALAPTSPRAAAGCAAVITGAVCVAVSYTWVKARVPRVDPASVLIWQMIAGTVPLAAIAYATEGNPLHVAWTEKALVAMLYLSVVGSIAAFWLNYWLLQRIHASAVLVMSIVEAPFAAVWGALFLGERLDALSYAGAALILAGAAAVITRDS